MKLIEKQSDKLYYFYSLFKNGLVFFHIITTLHLNGIHTTAKKIQAHTSAQIKFLFIYTFQQHMNCFDTLKKPLLKLVFIAFKHQYQSRINIKTERVRHSHKESMHNTDTYL